MKTLGVLICMSMLVVLRAGAQEAAFVPKQVVVSFQNKKESNIGIADGRITCQSSSVTTILETHKAVWMRRLYSGDKGAQNIYLIELENDADVESAIAELRSDPAIRSATRNHTVEFLIRPTDWYFNNDFYPPDNPDSTEDQWYLKIMQADKAWEVERGKPEITIAILDKGIDFFHPDLQGNIWVNPGEDLDNDRVVWDADDRNGDDDDGNDLVDDLVGWKFVNGSIGDNWPYPLIGEQHGTMMASVGAVTSTNNPADTSIAGISWGCKLVPLKIGDFPTWTHSSVIEALN